MTIGIYIATRNNHINFNFMFVTRFSLAITVIRQEKFIIVHPEIMTMRLLKSDYLAFIYFSAVPLITFSLDYEDNDQTQETVFYCTF